MTASSPRHEMEVKVRVGAGTDGRIRAIDVHTLSNTGAYGEHGPTTVGLSGTKSISLYRNLEAHRFVYDVGVHQRHVRRRLPGLRGHPGDLRCGDSGNELAAKLHMDPARLREINMVREGDVMTSYDSAQTTNSCALDRCFARVKELIGWEEKYPAKDLGNGRSAAWVWPWACRARAFPGWT